MALGNRTARRTCQSYMLDDCSHRAMSLTNAAIMWLALAGPVVSYFLAMAIYTYPTTCTASIACPFASEGGDVHAGPGSASSAVCVHLRDAHGIESDGVFSQYQGMHWTPSSYPHACHTDGGQVYEFDPLFIFQACLGATLATAAFGAFLIGLCTREHNGCAVARRGIQPRAAGFADGDARGFCVTLVVFTALGLVMLFVGACISADVQNRYTKAQCTDYARPQNLAVDMTILDVAATLDGVTAPYSMIASSWRPDPADFPMPCFVEIADSVATFMGPLQIILLTAALGASIVGYWTWCVLWAAAGAYVPLHAGCLFPAQPAPSNSIPAFGGASAPQLAEVGIASPATSPINRGAELAPLPLAPSTHMLVSFTGLHTPPPALPLMLAQAQSAPWSPATPCWCASPPVARTAMPTCMPPPCDNAVVSELEELDLRHESLQQSQHSQKRAVPYPLSLPRPERALQSPAHFRTAISVVIADRHAVGGFAAADMRAEFV